MEAYTSSAVNFIIVSGQFEGSKVFWYYVNTKRKYAAKVMSVTNHTQLWDTKLAWHFSECYRLYLEHSLCGYQSEILGNILFLYND